MKSLALNPACYRVSTLLSLDNRAVHELALRAAGSVTALRTMLGRCLLAMQESRGYREFGCSSAIHYGCVKLGMSRRVANCCKRVAQRLLGLPVLSRAAEEGKIDWGKLREIVRKATPETEEFWLRLAGKFKYEQIQALVSKTPVGAVPGDVDLEEFAYRCELRCQLSPEVFALLEQARRVYSLEKDEAVSTAEVLEWALSSYISGTPLDEKALAKVREESDKDLQAERARMIPVVAEARELAAEMGILDGPSEVDEEVEPTRAGRSDLEEEHPPTSSSEMEALLAQALGSLSPAAHEHHQTKISNPWSNTRLRFNPKSRHTTKAQKKEIMRRDGWCCSTPGCPHRVWLHIHHLESYSEGGPTEPRNLISLCSSCHQNVHRGLLRIIETTDGQLLYLDRQGHRLDIQTDLAMAGWLDWEIGWTGGETDSYSARYGSDWVVFST